MKQLIGLVMMLKDKVKFYCGKVDNERFVIMFSLFFTKFNLHIAFVPSYWKEFYYDVDGKKFIDNDIRHCLNISVFQFIYHDFTGIDIIHTIVDEEYLYYAPQQSDSLRKFMIMLKVLAENHNTFSCIPGRFKCSIKPNSKYIFYLTINRDWLILNNLGVLASIRFPDCYLSKEDIDYYFPEYGSLENEFDGFISYKKIDKFEGEA